MSELKNNMSNTGLQQYTATTFAGLEEVLAAELESLGAEEIEIAKRAVSFKGNAELMYVANLQCRLALNILVHHSTFTAKSDTELYNEVKKINWEDFLDVNMTFAIDATVNNSTINHTKYAALKAKDAIADQFREKNGARPNVDTEQPDLRIYLHINGDTCRLFFNSSGTSLHYRNYRTDTGFAPLNEVLAAGLIRLSGWDAQKPLLDFMCGSGTILIEAGLMAKNIPAGFFRKRFGFETWIDFDKVMWDKVWSEAKSNIKEKMPCKIFGCDNDYESISNTKANLHNAGLEGDVRIVCESFENAHAKLKLENEAGVIVSNPPYDKRLVTNDDVEFHKKIGDVLKLQYGGWQAYIFTGNMEAAKFIGLRPSRRMHLFNGKIECRLLKFDLWAKKAAE